MINGNPTADEQRHSVRTIADRIAEVACDTEYGAWMMGIYERVLIEEQRELCRLHGARA